DYQREHLLTLLCASASLWFPLFVRRHPGGRSRGSRDMQLGFVSAIVPDLSLEEVLAFAGDEGFACVELMCWPPGGADRRYAGVTHIDVTRLGDDELGRIKHLVQKSGVAISGLGYYPNPLHPDAGHRDKVIGHLRQVISAAPKLDVRVVNTFIGRDPHKS